MCCWWFNTQEDCVVGGPTIKEILSVHACACASSGPMVLRRKHLVVFLAASVSLVHVPPVAQWCSGEKILVAFWHPWGQVPPVAQRFCRGTILLHFSCNCIPEASASSGPIVFKGKHFGCIFCACVCVCVVFACVGPQKPNTHFHSATDYNVSSHQ